MSWLTTYLEQATTVASTTEAMEHNVSPDHTVSNEDNAFRENLDSTDVFAVGGPIANPVTRDILYGETGPDTAAGTVMEDTSRTWVFDLRPTTSVEHTAVSQLQEEDVHPRWPIVNRETRERFLPDNFNGTRRDFFLITYTVNPYNKQCDALVAAGCSQPGTQAAYTILHNKETRLEGSDTFHRYLVNGSDQGNTYFTVVGRCHVQNGDPVKVADVDFIQHQQEGEGTE